ncbi:Xylulose kinase [Lamellibrachia satsuma]|nr:Xylulose kinase [Lamellibrachia satsuma]
MASGDGVTLYAGFDFSTQQVKVVVINEQLQSVFEDSVTFDADLPEFRTEGGVHVGKDGHTITSPTLMWVKAADVLLRRMKDARFNFSQVAALSGTAQQHGSVYWATDSRDILRDLDPGQDLQKQLQNCFSIPNSPVWMDASTTEQCRHLEETLGGPEKLASITGMRAFERMTGNQIAKIYQTNREAYERTERISLVSSFAASLFIGDYAPIDESDGSGMNLLDIREKQWSRKCLDACAPELERRLGNVVPSYQCIGDISSYMVDRYGFSTECKVIAFTGDNPASLAGMRLREGDTVVSLGTSDTLLLWLQEPRLCLEGLNLVNPIDNTAYMSLVCFKNASLTRERIRDKCAGASWEKFDELLASTPPGNNGRLGMYFDVQEITPYAVGVYRFDADDQPMTSFSNETEVRALIEGQCLAKRLYAERLGCSTGPHCRLLATGGASCNKFILQVLADVFQTPVFIQDVANSACLGSAYRAKHGWLGGEKISFHDVVKDAPDVACAVRPNSETVQIYNPLLARYATLEERIINNL